MNAKIEQHQRSTTPENLIATDLSRVKLIIRRDQIEGKDYSPTIYFLLNNASDRNSVERIRGSVSIEILGYEKDPRELWEIPMVQLYMKKILSMWTEWIFFANLNDDTLLFCTLCLLSAKKDPRSQGIYLCKGVWIKVIEAFDGVEGLIVSQGLDRSVIRQVEIAVTEYLRKRLQPRLMP